ncbi:MAG: cysteine hydrolase family protein [Gemmatimonadales bacterium]
MSQRVEIIQGGRTIARDMPYAPGHVTLLLVDMQRIWVEPGLDPAYPDASPEDYLYRELRDRVVPNQRRLLAAARAASAQVVHTIIESLTEDGRDRSLDHKLSPIHVPKGAPEGRVIPELEPIVNEVVLPKTSSGVFNSTAIDYVLTNLETRFLIVAGMVTDQCVDMAVRDAADRGYLVTLVDDACVAASAERHASALRALRGYCWTADTAQVVGRLESLGR